jgi:uncharacterized protein YegL
MSEYASVDEDLINNPAARCPCILLLDTSQSMEGEPIRLLNEGVKTLIDEIMADDQASLSVEICIITFGGRVSKVCDFGLAHRIALPKLEAAGSTPMGDAVKLGLGELADRIFQYSEKGISRYRPLVVLMTDGMPTGSDGKFDPGYKNDAKVLRAASMRPHKDATGVRVCTVAIGEKANKSILAEFGNPSEPPIAVDPKEFRKLFRWVSVYLADVVHSVDGKLDDW